MENNQDDNQGTGLDQDDIMNRVNYTFDKIARMEEKGFGKINSSMTIK